MKLSIGEIAKMAGVSVRTLHYYNEIGLLTPSMVVEETGYRYYDEGSLATLQQILFYRELDFPLKEINEMMSAPNYDKTEALRRQRQLLLLKKERMERLIDLLDANRKGDNEMKFEAFDNSKIEQTRKQYAEEIKERWGNTKAYEESQKKVGQYGAKENEAMMDEYKEIMTQFAALVGAAPEDERVQKLVAAWQNHITKHYYQCTKEILAGLGKMYIGDERFQQNMDEFGEGTAKLVSDGIEVYCGERC